MLSDAKKIFEQVDLLEVQVEAVLSKLDSLTNIDELVEQEAILLDLLEKLEQEEQNMDTYMAKYKKIILNEKQQVLLSARTKKQETLRGVYERQAGSCRCKKL